MNQRSKRSRQALRSLAGSGFLVAAALAFTLMNALTLALLVACLALWIVLTRQGRLAAAVLGIGLSTLSQRKGATIVIVAGIGGVVAVLVALQSMSQGLERTLHSTGDTQTAIILSGSPTESASLLTREQVALIADKPGILRDRDGKAVLSAETLGVLRLIKKSSGERTNVGLRGVNSQATNVHRSVRIVDGRLFRPGLQELVVGQSARSLFKGLETGQTVAINEQQWKIVGAFASGDAHESELLGDADTLAAAFRRTTYQSVIVRLTAPEALDQLKAALVADRRLSVNVHTTLDYYMSGTGGRVEAIRIVTNVIAVIMAMGAFFGSLNVSYTTVQARSREIATLRAIGFPSVPVLVSVMLETLMLAALGGGLGASLAWAIFHDFTGSTSGAGLGALIFNFDVSPALIWTGLKWALAIGFLGGMLPALTAATLPTATALKAT
jgi:putative ABC transport system permease protein